MIDHDETIEEGHRALQMLRQAYDEAVANGGVLECVEGTWYRVVEAAQRDALPHKEAA